MPEIMIKSPGPRSSAVAGGYTFLHEELERGLALLKETEACLLFPTGFAANMAVVSALCSDAEVTIFSDELNHASIIDGARLAARSQVHCLLPSDVATRCFVALLIIGLHLVLVSQGTSQQCMCCLPCTK